MLTGRFGNTSGRPYIEGRLVIPRLNARADFSFVVDTGADNTFLMPGDGRTMGLDYSQLATPAGPSLGAGGPITSFAEQAWVAFSDGSNLYGYSVRIAILEYRTDMLQVPTLLGRDILHRWRMVYDHPANKIEFEVVSADVLIPGANSLNPRITYQ